MARWATYVKGDTLGGIISLIVDSGNFSPSKDGDANYLKAEYVAKSMKKIGYAAVNIGKRELSLGSRLLSDLKGKYNLPLVSANVYCEDSERRFTRPYVIKRVGGSNFLGVGYGGIKVGILGLAAEISQGEKETAKKPQNPPKEGRMLAVRDPIDEAEKVIRELRGKSDLIVVLTEMGMGRLGDLVNEVEGIDVIIGGRVKTPHGKPTRLAEAVFVRPGSQGKYGGLMTVAVGDDGEITSFEGEAIPMDDTVPKDEEVSQLISDHNKEQKALRERPPSSPPLTYAGAKSCRKCHREQFNQWEETAHAHAFATLAEKDKKPKCLRCHTTGYRQDNGFWNEKTTPDLVNVQCEVCHGGGYDHVQKFQEAQGERQLSTGDFRTINSHYCRRCHNKKWDPDFNYDEDRKKIVH